MKLRQPNADPPSCDFSTEPGPGIWRESFEVVTLTPIYGGGVKAGEPDPLMPVRAAAIRGQLRFWWRLLKQHHPEKPLTGAELFAAEREIWGGMAEKNQDYASKVRVRVNEFRNKRKVPCKAFLSNQQNPALDYVLFPARNNPSSELLEAGMRFTLTVEYPDQYRTEVIETLRWWASFGGLGARSRRGLGAVSVKYKKPDNEFLGPVTEEEAKRYGCLLIPKKDRKTKAVTVLKDAIEAWSEAVTPLRDFRQKPDLGRNPGQSPNRPGRSRWPEPDSIRVITNCPDLARTPTARHPPKHPAGIGFPRAAFGLPIIFEFKGEPTDPYKTELASQYEGGRMASPLILKPMAWADKQYASVALLLPVGHLKRLQPTLKKSGASASSPPLYPSRSHSEPWWDSAQASKVKPIQSYQGQDALAAFLNYFAKG